MASGQVAFTVALFVAGLSFGAGHGGAELEDAAKLGMIVASVLAAVAASALHVRSSRR